MNLPPHDWITPPTPEAFVLISENRRADIVYDPDDHKVIGIACRDFARDVARVSGQTPDICHTPNPERPCILVGTLGHSRWIDALAEQGRIPELDTLQGQWEGYLIAHLRNPLPGIPEALVIAGSDRRGCAYGVYQLSQAIGVSPWYWWAEMPVPHRDSLHIRGGLRIQDHPHVRYRGMFLNDEIFGLGPWALKTFEPESPKAIGPKTYKKIFELMLRLRANYLWPAIKRNYSPISLYPETRKCAEDYAIVIGSQHSEPLTMYAGEWDAQTRGEWNYFTNKAGILSFLEERVAENKAYENVYTMGLRGIDDRKMEGDPSIPEQVAVLNEVIREQRDILRRQIADPVESIPQSIVLYKEVHTAYKFGLDLPEDITLIWAEDNYGYIKQLPDSSNRDRSGGHGVYYHLSYLGRPFDYLWLSGMHPHLMLSELQKAVAYGADRIWVFNVGDIKAVEYDLSLAMDIAWAPDRLDHENLHAHRQQFYAQGFPAETAQQMARLRIRADQLAFDRRPEHMAWQRLEQGRLPVESEFSWIHGQEAETRLEAYRALAADSAAVLNTLPADMHDGYWHLLHYRILGSALMNEKWLQMSRYAWHQRQGRSSAGQSFEKAWEAFAQTWEATDRYTGAADGKWAHFHGMFPFDVYGEPRYRRESDAEERRWIRPDPFEPLATLPSPPTGIDPRLWLQGEAETVGLSASQRALPVLSPLGTTQTFFEIYNRGTDAFDFSIESDVDWLEITPASCRWEDLQDVRVAVQLLPDLLPTANGMLTAQLNIRMADRCESILVPVFAPAVDATELTGKFVEQAGIVSIPAQAFTDSRDSDRTTWQRIHNMGTGGSIVTAGPVDARRFADDWGVKAENPYLEYRFYSFNRGWATLESTTLPTHPSNAERASVYAVSINEGPELICDFSTYQRDEQWMQAVERNRITLKTRHFIDHPGWQTLRVYLCDPGVFFDHFLVDFGGRKATYLPTSAPHDRQAGQEVRVELVPHLPPSPES